MRLVAATISILALCSCSSVAERQAQDLVRHDMMDPDAAQFRDVKVISDGHCVIGEVNGKNRMGAYTGFRPFIVDLRSSKIAVVPDEPLSERGASASDYVVTMARVKVIRMDCSIENTE